MLTGPTLPFRLSDRLTGWHADRPTLPFWQADRLTGWQANFTFSIFRQADMLTGQLYLSDRPTGWQADRLTGQLYLLDFSTCWQADRLTCQLYSPVWQVHSGRSRRNKHNITSYNCNSACRRLQKSPKWSSIRTRHWIHRAPKPSCTMIIKMWQHLNHNHQRSPLWSYDHHRNIGHWIPCPQKLLFTNFHRNRTISKFWPIRSLHFVFYSSGIYVIELESPKTPIYHFSSKSDSL